MHAHCIVVDNAHMSNCGIVEFLLIHHAMFFPISMCIRVCMCVVLPIESLLWLVMNYIWCVCADWCVQYL